MDHARAQDTRQSEDAQRVIRRVRSPSRPRAWLSRSYKPKFEGRFFRSRFPRDGHSFYNQKYHCFNPKDHFHFQRDHFQPRLSDREKEREWYEPRESAEGSSPPKLNRTSRPFLPRSTSSRDKDMHFSVCQSVRNQSREKDHMRTRSKDRERSRDEEIPSTASQTATRDRAILRKKREIDEILQP